ncbi:MAG: DUF2922 domain-containing protein [Bacillota bacterium]|jgi:hypothetical protein
MAEVKKVLRMSFEAQDGSTMSLTLDNPKMGLTQSDIEGAMDIIISKNIFAPAGGDLVAKKDAKIIDTITTDMYDPA